MKSKLFWMIFLSLVLMFASGCDVVMPEEDTGLRASGVVEAEDISISPEISGKIAAVFVAEGDRVTANTPLFELDGALIAAQETQVQAALEAAQTQLNAANTALEAANASETIAEAGLIAAEAGVQSAQAGLDTAVLQAEIILAEARAADQQARQEAWEAEQLNEFETPVWYFDKETRLQAAEEQVESAADALDAELENLDSVIEDIGGADLEEAEQRLIDAQAAFSVADAILEQAKAGDGGPNNELDDYAQSVYDSTLSELEAAQLDYDQILSDQEETDLLEARARVSVARAQRQAAQDQLDVLLTGDEALNVQLAEKIVQQAEAAVTAAQAGVIQAEAQRDQVSARIAEADARVQQARAGVTQAEAQLNMINTERGKLVVSAPQDGVITVLNASAGEVAMAGVSVLKLSVLDDLTVTVYIPEDEYGSIQLGEQVEIEADSFPGRTFAGTVRRIADQAEYTPRNVQTEEDRRTTVYAVILDVSGGEGELKPGMPVDVRFE